LSCNSETCALEVQVPCRWGVWSEWGNCDVCGSTGQRTRERSVAQSPKNGGSNCDEADSQQMTQCDKPCGKTYCTWNDWAAWGQCDATCGHAQKARRRSLFSSDVEKKLPLPKESFAVKYAELEAHIQSLNSSRWQDLSSAFALGGTAFLILLAAMRLVSLVRSPSTHQYSRMLSTDVMPSDINLDCSSCSPTLPPNACGGVSSVRGVQLPSAEPSMPENCLDMRRGFNDEHHQDFTMASPYCEHPLLEHEESSMVPLVASLARAKRPADTDGAIDFTVLDWGEDERSLE